MFGVFGHLQVCSKCVLKQSCNFVNQNVWNRGAKNLDLADVMNTITLYALDAVPPQLVVSDEVKSSVSRLLKEVLRLSTSWGKFTICTTLFKVGWGLLFSVIAFFGSNLDSFSSEPCSLSMGCTCGGSEIIQPNLGEVFTLRSGFAQVLEFD